MKSNYPQPYYNGFNYWHENKSNGVKQKKLKQTRRKSSPCSTQNNNYRRARSGGQNTSD